MVKIARLFFLVLIANLPMFAQSPQPAPGEASHFPFPEEEVYGDDGHFTMQLLQMFALLGLLIGLLLFVSWFLKRMMQTRIQQVNESSAIKVLEQRAVSTRTTIYALDIEGKTYIFAETPSAVTPLYPIVER